LNEQTIASPSTRPDRSISFWWLGRVNRTFHSRWWWVIC